MKNLTSLFWINFGYTLLLAQFCAYLELNLHVKYVTHIDCNTHKETVRLGSRLTSGVSVSSFPPQLTFRRAPGAGWALPRSSVQLQPLERSSGQPSVTLHSDALLWRSSSRNIRTQNGMRMQGPDIVPHTISCAAPYQPMTSQTCWSWW